MAVALPDDTIALAIGYGRQPEIQYNVRPVVWWPVPGSGVYDMRITVTRDDSLTRTESIYLVPLYVPRR